MIDARSSNLRADPLGTWQASNDFMACPENILKISQSRDAGDITMIIDCV
jgi:hypothetical protein